MNRTPRGGRRKGISSRQGAGFVGITIIMTLLAAALTALSGRVAAAAVSRQHRAAAFVAGFARAIGTEAPPSTVCSGSVPWARQRRRTRLRRGWREYGSAPIERRFGGERERCKLDATIERNADAKGHAQEDGGDGSNEKPQFLLPDWRSDQSLNDVYDLPTLSVPAESVHSVLGGVVKPYVATHMEELDGVHPRVKVVRDFPKGKQQIHEEEGEDQAKKDGKRKLLLLDPNRVIAQVDTEAAAAASVNQDVNGDEDFLSEPQLSEVQRGYYANLRQSYPGIPSSVHRTLAAKSIHPGPPYAMTVPYTQQTPTRILRKLLPPSAQPPPTGYEQVGHVLHLNLKPHHDPYGELIGDVILDKFQPNVRSVVSKLGEVSGPYRTYEMNVLAGEDDTKVTLTEHGVALKFDLAKVYWSTRLSGERSRTLREEFKPGQTIADAFCGAGALCVRAAVELNCTVLGNDLNPDAVRYCRDNARRNGAGDKVRVECGDARDFIAGLGMRTAVVEGDASDGENAEVRLPHHLMLNYPLAATDFLGALRWWPSHGSMDVVPTVHVYTFARGDDKKSGLVMGCRDAAEVAIDLVAKGLFPEEINGDAGVEGAPGRGGRATLDGLGCHVQAKEVRDVAPGKVVICVSFRATPDLLRCMQGEIKV